MTNTSSQTTAHNEPLWLRIIFVVLFYILFGLLELLILGLLIVQFLHLLIVGRRHPELAQFARGLGRYVGQIAAYVTWASDTKPYPFSDWPGKAQDREEGSE